jgi:hypothetical protein
MAACDTPPAGRRFGKFYGNLPGTKGGYFPDVALLVTGMDLMASKAGPPFFPVNMKIMKVPISVSKIGQGGGLVIPD